MDHFNFNYATILDAATVAVTEASPDGLNTLQQPQPPTLSSPQTRPTNIAIASQSSLSSVARSGVDPSNVVLSSSSSTTPITSITFTNPVSRTFQPLELTSGHFYNSVNIHNLIEGQKKIYKEFTDKFNCISEHVSSFIQILEKLVCQQADLNLQFTTAFDYMSRDHTKQLYEHNTNYYHHGHPYYHRRQNDLKNFVVLPSSSQQYVNSPLNHTQTQSSQSNNHTTYQQNQQQHHHYQSQLQKNGNVYFLCIFKYCDDCLCIFLLQLETQEFASSFIEKIPAMNFLANAKSCYSLCVYRLEPEDNMTDDTHRQWYIFITQNRTVRLSEVKMKKKHRVRAFLGRWDNVPPTQITREAIYNALSFLVWHSSKHIVSIGGTLRFCSLYEVRQITDAYIMKIIKNVLTNFWKSNK